MIKYRPDIDGLRTIAVGGVVLFHAFPWLLSGGFVGVDVFFVLSGYLITSIIFGEAQRGDFSIARFYERRFRRILPALVLVALATTVAAIVILSPSELDDYGKSLFGVATFTANFVFWWDTGYFASEALDRPLLHTWSLAVEEQFYILWPLIVPMLARRKSARPLRAFVVATVIVSLLLSIVGLQLYPEATFYMLPTRAWELGLGAMLAVRAIPAIRTAMVRETAAILGLLLILVPMVMYSEAMPFPGLAALPPCLGAVLIIHAGDKSSTLAGRALSVGPVLYVGLISYSLYLWHWPWLVLPRIALGRPLTAIETIAAVGMAFVLAILSTKFVEARFRGRGAWPVSRAKVLGASAGIAGVLAVAGMTLVKTDGLRAISGPAVQVADRANDAFNPRRPNCHMERTPASNGTLGHADKCIAGRPDAVTGYDVLLWGDSHADHLMPGLASMAKEGNFEIRQTTASGCSPILRFIAYIPKLAPCTASYQNALEEAARQADIDTVVVSSSWSAVLASLTATTANNDPELAERQFADGLRYIVRWIHSEIPKARIVFVGSTPDYDLSLPKCFARAAKVGFGDSACAAREPNDHIWGPKADKILATMRDNGVTVVLPRSAFCKGDICKTRQDGHILYYDDDHLSIDGSKIVARPIMAAIRS
ncbi:hypothetical protein ASE73_17410 [Sphingomonas sp. Leaf24]|uniref:acyltransferase family protein n=1 Tax=unclassified Sphingomonas TaxID=196159 RepID=UPI0006FE1F04|nr:MULTISPECIES: acyltransferase family protein [unclassified Sphingomonas]KQM19788.1 hypothetical protein ASE50_17300 [Sphingomonas sp. Leaf5]KQM91394.1 hypothetical protein ASE73_17410 [Sphingomonas sp. Leaf24]KQM93496.1 hypothetical protein ASE70_13870 [Sphingomonas sp. Leaf22]